MNAYDIVKGFEEALGEYTGAPHVVCVDSCTNAIFLALSYCAQERGDTSVEVPRHTYVGVAQAVRNAGLDVVWSDEMWVGQYIFRPTYIIDSAKRFERDMFHPGYVECVSFHVAKRLPLGHGGAILHDDPHMDEWLRRARFDGRTQGETGENAQKVTVPGYHMYMTPDDAARGLWLLQQYVDMPLNPEWSNYPDISEMMP